MDRDRCRRRVVKHLPPSSPAEGPEPLSRNVDLRRPTEVLAAADEAGERLPHPVVPPLRNSLLRHQRDELSEDSTDRLVNLADAPLVRFLGQALTRERDMGDLLVRP